MKILTFVFRIIVLQVFSRIQYVHTVLRQCSLCVFEIPTWLFVAKTLRISMQDLVFPAAEYCASVWSRSPHMMKKVDVAINSCAGLRRKAATLALAWKAVKHDWHILHDTTTNGVPPYRLKSVNPTTRRLSRC